MCLVYLECELLKDDFCEFIELGDDIPLNVMFPFVNAVDCCGIVRHDFNVFMTCFHKWL